MYASCVKDMHFSRRLIANSLLNGVIIYDKYDISMFSVSIAKMRLEKTKLAALNGIVIQHGKLFFSTLYSTFFFYKR